MGELQSSSQRSNLPSEMAETHCIADYIGAGPIFLDLERYAAHADGRALPLTRLEFDILAYLMQHADRVVSQQELMQEVVRRVLTEHSCVIRVHVSHLRRKLGPYSAAITTVRARGFRFVDCSANETRAGDGDA